MTWRKGEKRTSKARQLASPPVEVIAHRRSKTVSPLAGSEAMSPPTGSFSTSVSSNGSVRQFPKEVDATGNIEHKFRLIGIAKERLEHLRTQMKWRVEEGRGEALYRIGVMDNGDALGLNQDELEESLDTLVRVGGPLGFEAVVLEKFEGIVSGHQCATVAIRKAWTTPLNKCASASSVAHEVRVAIVGASESGKSSIAGYLTRGVADDGHGKTARSVALHKHEIRIGRTTSFSSHSLPPQGTAQSKAVVMRGVENIFSDMDLDHDLGESRSIPSKIVSLIDTGGHRKALTSCLRGLSACAPDYFLLCLDLDTAAGENPQRLSVALDFLRLAQRALVPYVIVITKCDADGAMEPNPEVLQQLGDDLMRVTGENMEAVVANMPLVVPVVHVSAITGTGMDCLSQLLNLLPCRSSTISELLDLRESSSVEGDAASEESSSSSCSKQPSLLGISRTFLLDAEDTLEEEDQEEGLFGGGRESDSASPASLDQEPHQRVIVIGLVQSGAFEVDQTLFVGPKRDSGAFTRAKVVSMRCASGAAVSSAVAGTTVSLHLQFLDANDGATFARRGAFVCDRPSDLESLLARSFDVVIDSSTELKKNEELVAFNGVISQACRVVDPALPSENGNTVTSMQFVFRAEYLVRGTVFFKRSDGSTLVGRVMRIR